MGGQSTTSQQSTTQPWQAAQPALKGILSQLETLIPNSGLSQTSQGAIAQLQGNAQAGNPYASAISGTVGNLLNGGGATDQIPALQNGLNTFTGQTNPLASNTNYDPMQTPGFSDALKTAMSDITERRAAERAMQESAAELHGVFNAMRDIVLVLSRDGVYLKVVGIASSDRCVFNEAGIDLSRWQEQLELATRSPMTAQSLEPVLERLERLPLPIMVDCTAASGTEEFYVRAFARGIHVVAANKKPLALPQQQRDALMAAAKRHHRFFCYETTVGASLPIWSSAANCCSA